jgi:hypothetical protein
MPSQKKNSIRCRVSQSMVSRSSLHREAQEDKCLRRRERKAELLTGSESCVRHGGCGAAPPILEQIIATFGRMTLGKHCGIIALGSVFSFGVLFLMLLETNANGLSSWWSIALRVPIWAGTKYAVGVNQIDSAAFYTAWIAECVVGGILIDLVTSVAIRKKRSASPPAM